MSGFPADWLDLREPADARARSGTLAAGLAAALGARTASADALAVTDLGGGTGANLRWLAPRLDGVQHWTVLDNDAALLAAQPARFDRWARANDARCKTGAGHAGSPAGCHIDSASLDVTVTPQLIDLDSALDAVPVPAHGLVTASALLDLVSAGWLERLVDRIVAGGSAACFALTYDGRIGLTPSLPADDRLRELVNRHQRGDKGFGPALGPTAAGAAAAAFRRRGWHTTHARSDWRLDAGDAALMRALLDGWCDAAGEIEPGSTAKLGSWAATRHGQIERGELTIVVGHTDLIALPD